MEILICNECLQTMGMFPNLGTREKKSYTETKGVKMSNNSPAREYIGVYTEVCFKPNHDIACYGYQYGNMGRYFNEKDRFEAIKNHLYQIDFLSFRNKIILIGEFDPENVFCFNRDQYGINPAGFTIGAFKITENLVTTYKQRFSKYYREVLSFMQEYAQKVDVNFGTLLYFK